MRIQTIIILLLVFLTYNLKGQTRRIQGRILSEDLESIPMVRILSADTLLLGESDMDGRFNITIPQKTSKLLLSMVGMEWTSLNLKEKCDNVEIIMMYFAIYDFISLKKIDRLRFKRFQKLPELHQLAFEKKLFLTQKACYEQNFHPIKKN